MDRPTPRTAIASWPEDGGTPHGRGRHLHHSLGATLGGAHPREGTVDTTVSAPIAGLSPGTTYHYRVVFESESGTKYGQDRTWSTAASGHPIYLPLVQR